MDFEGPDGVSSCSLVNFLKSQTLSVSLLVASTSTD